jgi:hypothetical protein
MYMFLLVVINSYQSNLLITKRGREDEDERNIDRV